MTSKLMTNKLLLGAALSALMLSGALAAQSPPAPNASNHSAPLAVAPAKPGGSAAGIAVKPNTATKAAAAKNTATQGQNGQDKPHVVTSQEPDQWLASKFKGTGVFGAANRKIGAVADILFDKTGKIKAYVVSFGGFLGMGAKEVALAPSSFQVMRGKNGKQDTLKLAMNKKELQQTPSFTPYQPPMPTTHGVGKMGGGLTHRSPMAPIGH